MYPWIIITVVSLVLTFISKSIEEKRPIKEGKLADTYVLLIRFAHFFIVLFNVSYIFLFDTSFDVFYLLLNLIMYLHWFAFKNNCILTHLERKYYDIEHRRNDIYLELLFGKHTSFIMPFLGILSMINVLVVLFRQSAIPLNSKFGIAFVFITYTVFMWTWSLARI